MCSSHYIDIAVSTLTIYEPIIFQGNITKPLKSTKKLTDLRLYTTPLFLGVYLLITIELKSNHINLIFFT